MKCRHRLCFDWLRDRRDRVRTGLGDIYSFFRLYHDVICRIIACKRHKGDAGHQSQGLRFDISDDLYDRRYLKLLPNTKLEKEITAHDWTTD
jgi:hypothetical protein